MKISKFKAKKGFTLIEVVVVMAIIAVLAALVVGAIRIARNMANDTKRISDMRTIQAALEAYKAKYKQYPTAVASPASSACGGWEIVTSSGNLAQELKKVGLDPMPMDSKYTSESACTGYRYYRYPNGYASCTGGNYYVLAVTTMDGGKNSSGSGWSCPDRNWANEVDWVAGSYE